MAEDGQRGAEAKICGVCGDKALGYNFNAITCESCKAFFRRNALKTKSFKCPFDNNCKVDVVTRRFCQRCRLKKCIEIGMKKEWIMTDEEKKMKKAKIAENKNKRQNSSSIKTKDTVNIKVESPDTTINQYILSPAASLSPLTPGSTGCFVDIAKYRIPTHQPLTPSECEDSPPPKVLHSENSLDVHTECFLSSEDGETSDCGSVIDLEFKSCTENSGVSNPTPQGPAGMELITAKSIETCFVPTTTFSSPLSQVLQVTSTTTQLHSQTVTKCVFSDQVQSPTLSSASEQCEPLKPITNSPLSPSVFKVAVGVEFADIPIRNHGSKLSTPEKNRLNELIVANEVLKLPLTWGVPDPSLLDVINMTDHAIRRLIKMSKKLSAFKSLCQNDQIALLKGGCTELMILRSVMSYNPEKNCWQGPQGPESMSINMDILKEAKGNVYEEHKRFINSFEPVWRADENIMLLLSAIALFTPERPNTVHKCAIKLEQETYYYLLRRYLETIYPGCEARMTYLRLIQMIAELHNLNENHVRVYLNVNPKDVEPLLIEIFDLKH